MNIESQGSFDVCVAQGPLNDFWRYASICERRAQAVAERVHARLASGKPQFLQSDCGVLVLFCSDKVEPDQATSADIAARDQQISWKHFITGSNHESFRSIKSFGPGGFDEGGVDAS